MLHSGPNKDQVFGMIDIMQTAFNTNNGGNVAATPEGWVILSRVADVRLTGTVTNSQAGAAFVVAVAGCMADLSAGTSPLVLPTTLTANSNLLWRVCELGHLGNPHRQRFERTDRWEEQGGDGARPVSWLADTGASRQRPMRRCGRAASSTPSSLPIHDTNPLLGSAPQIDKDDADSAAYQGTGGPWPFNAFELLTVPTTAVGATGVRAFASASASMAIQRHKMARFTTWFTTTLS